jgi:hypothetical protein
MGDPFSLKKRAQAPKSEMSRQPKKLIMKKLIFISSVFTLLFSTATLAQNARIGVSGGLNFANLSRTIGGFDKDGDYRIGLIGGMMLDVPLCKKSPISFQPDFRYTQKGSAEPLVTPIVKNYVALRYAELATNFVYNFNNKGGGTFYLGAGPYLALPLPSKKVEKIAGSPKVNNEISFGNLAANHFKGVDYGADFVMGYRNKAGIFLGVNYTQGARNLVPNEVLDIPASKNDKVKNISFGIRVGFLFKSDSKK